MKTFYIFLTLILFSPLISTAQSYRPLLDTINQWSYTCTLIPVSPQQRSASSNCPGFVMGSLDYYTVIDTIINSVSYKQLFANSVFIGAPCQQGYIREDTATRKIYFRELTLAPERLLYDFQLAIGDSIYVDGGTQFDYFPAGYYVLDSIVPFNTISGLTNAYKLNSGVTTNQLIWLEGSGFPGDLIYDRSAINSGGGLFASCYSMEPWVNYEKILICNEHTQKVFFDSCAYAMAVGNWCFNLVDSCNFYNICGSVHELSSIGKIEVSPNPSNGNVQISFEVLKKDEISFELQDISGRAYPINENVPVSVGKQQIPLQLPKLIAGIYLLRLTGKNGVSSVKITIVE